MNRFAMLAATLALVPCAFFAPTAHAAPAAAKPLVAQTLTSFEQDSTRIRKEMQQDGKYGYISSAERTRVEARLTDMQNLLAAHMNAADMRETDKVALLNAQEEINGILDHNDNSRLICEHKTRLGSNIPVTTCRTHGEVMAERFHAQQYLQSRSQVFQQKTGH